MGKTSNTSNPKQIRPKHLAPAVLTAVNCLYLLHHPFNLFLLPHLAYYVALTVIVSVGVLAILTILVILALAIFMIFFLA